MNSTGIAGASIARCVGHVITRQLIEESGIPCRNFFMVINIIFVNKNDIYKFDSRPYEVTITVSCHKSRK